MLVPKRISHERLLRLEEDSQNVTNIAAAYKNVLGAVTIDDLNNKNNALKRIINVNIENIKDEDEDKVKEKVEEIKKILKDGKVVEGLKKLANNEIMDIIKQKFPNL